MIKPIFRSNIRFKLVFSLLSIVLLTGILSTIVGINIINKNVIREAYENVRSSLAATNELYEEEIARRSRTVQYLAEDSRDRPGRAPRRTGTPCSKSSSRSRQEFAFDIVNVVDPEGKVLVRGNAFEAWGDSMAHYRTIQEVVKTLAPAAGTGVLDPENIRFEGKAVADRTLIRVVPTPHALPRSSPVESRAMVIKIAAPILEGGRLRGILYAAVLLNNNSEFVDRFKRLVFKDEKIRGKDVGTTTLFLGDIRVATNVADSEGRRAIGTQVSSEVYRRVFEEGKTWVDEAFVVNNWYLSGYSPIVDIDHKPLGILYVGILKQKYDLGLLGTTLSFLAVIFVTTLLAIALAVYLINIYTRPLKRIIAASTEMALGFYHRIEADPHDDDARNLSRAFNSMVDAIQERDRQLKEQAERTILKSEKLASIGRMASGIAHEINNPLTGVLTYSSLLLEDMKGTKYEEDLRIIRDETLRCRGIVRGILDFARDTKAEKVPADINLIIEESLRMLEKHVNFQNVGIVKALDRGIPQVSVDAGEIRSVINNLAVNAADAMPNGGKLTIATGLDPDSGMVIIRVADTGIGIGPENLRKIFEPFFTTKDKGKGTGLGLAMTYGVIQRHNGTIDVRSEVGKGTEFIIKLPPR